MKKTICFVLCLQIMLSMPMVHAESEMRQVTKEYTEVGTLYINNRKVLSEDTVLFGGKSVVFPLRTIFESLGAQVIWHEDTRSTIINYLNHTYICDLKTMVVGNKEYFVMRRIKEGNEKHDEPIYLNSMSDLGLFFIINDRIYLGWEPSEYLFDYFGFNVEVDLETKEVKITQK